MANYLITNPIIKKVGLLPDGSIDPKKNPDGKREYLVCTLLNSAYLFDIPKVHTMFNEGHIALFKPYLSVAHGGTAEADQPLPEGMKFLSGAWATWLSAVPFHKRYLTDIQAREPSINNPKGRPAYQAGHLVMNADGSVPLIFTSIEVFTQFFIDPITNEKTYIKGETVNELGMQAFANYCVPVSTPATNSEETGGMAAAQPVNNQQPTAGTATTTPGSQTPPSFTNPNPTPQGGYTPPAGGAPGVI